MNEISIANNYCIICDEWIDDKIPNNVLKIQRGGTNTDAYFYELDTIFICPEHNDPINIRELFAIKKFGK